MFPLPPVDREERGKPFFPGHPALRFNLSHSGDLALCALDGAPVGADIQTAAPRRPATVERCCAPGERVWLAGRGDSWEDFALLWALKEAMVKHSGRGLTAPISAICPPLPRGDETLLERSGLFFRLYAGPGWRGRCAAASLRLLNCSGGPSRRKKPVISPLLFGKRLV